MLMSSSETLITTWRRASLRPIYTDTELVDGANDYDRARKKVERNVLLQAGFRSVQLWSVAMDAFMASRQMRMLIPTYSKSVVSSSTDSTSSGSAVLRSKDVNSRNSSRTLSTDIGRLALSDSLGRYTNPNQKHSYAATVAVTSPRRSVDSAMPITNVTNKPIAPTIIRVVPSKRQQANGDRDRRSKNKSSTSLPGPIERDDSVDRFVKWQQHILTQNQSHHGGASDGYRDRSLQCGLPLPVCQQVLQHVLCVDDLEMLSERQQRKALEWGQLKDTLMTEYDWRNRDKSSQIWMLLEAVEGLVYE